MYKGFTDAEKKKFLIQLVWRRNRMIILITGASHTGKTVLAQKLLEKYKYP